MSQANEHQQKLSEKRRLWKDHIDAWHASGLSQIEYCRRHQLTYAQFTYWKRRFTPKTSAAVSLVEVPVSNHLDDWPSALCVQVGKGIQIQVYPGFDPVTLKQLVLTLVQL